MYDTVLFYCVLVNTAMEMEAEEGIAGDEQFLAHASQYHNLHNLHVDPPHFFEQGLLLSCI